MSEKWEQLDGLVIARRGVAKVGIDAITPALAKRIVTAVNNHEPLVKFVRAFERLPTSADDVIYVMQDRAKALLADIDKESS